MKVLAFYAYPEMSNCHLKPQKRSEMFLAPEIFSGIVFANFNDNCSAQDKCRVPKLVWLEQSDHENSEYVKKKYFLACL
jgi:hypothetical protein